MKISNPRKIARSTGIGFIAGAVLMGIFGAGPVVANAATGPNAHAYCIVKSTPTPKWVDKQNPVILKANTVTGTTTVICYVQPSGSTKRYGEIDWSGPYITNG